MDNQSYFNKFMDVSEIISNTLMICDNIDVMALDGLPNELMKGILGYWRRL